MLAARNSGWERVNGRGGEFGSEAEKHLKKAERENILCGQKDRVQAHVL
jgi:hypothetical protein